MADSAADGQRSGKSIEGDEFDWRAGKRVCVGD